MALIFEPVSDSGMFVPGVMALILEPVSDSGIFVPGVMALILESVSDSGIFVPGVMALIFEPVLGPNILEVILEDFSEAFILDIEEKFNLHADTRHVVESAVSLRFSFK
jgi:hypothetical protein